MELTQDQLIDHLSNMTVMQLSELRQALEEKWDVKAASGGGVIMAAPTDGGGAAAEEKTEFDLILKGAGAKKIQVIKEVRAITGLGLKEAKDLVEGAPKPVKEGIAKDEAEELAKKLEAVGAETEIK